MEKFNYGNLDQRNREITEKYVRKLMRLHSTKDVPKEKTKTKISDPSEVIEIKKKELVTPCLKNKWSSQHSIPWSDHV